MPIIDFYGRPRWYHICATCGQTVTGGYVSRPDAAGDWAYHHAPACPAPPPADKATALYAALEPTVAVLGRHMKKAA